MDPIHFECSCGEAGFGLKGCPFHGFIDVVQGKIRLRFAHEGKEEIRGHLVLRTDQAREFAAILYALAIEADA